MSKFTVGERVEHARYRWGVGEIVGIVANKYLSCMEARYVVQFSRFAHTLYAADMKAVDVVEIAHGQPDQRRAFGVVDGGAAA